MGRPAGEGLQRAGAARQPRGLLCLRPQAQCGWVPSGAGDSKEAWVLGLRRRRKLNRETGPYIYGRTWTFPGLDAAAQTWKCGWATAPRSALDTPTPIASVCSLSLSVSPQDSAPRCSHWFSPAKTRPPAQPRPQPRPHSPTRRVSITRRSSLGATLVCAHCGDLPPLQHGRVLQVGGFSPMLPSASHAVSGQAWGRAEEGWEQGTWRDAPLCLA